MVPNRLGAQAACAWLTISSWITGLRRSTCRLTFCSRASLTASSTVSALTVACEPWGTALAAADAWIWADVVAALANTSDIAAVNARAGALGTTRITKAPLASEVGSGTERVVRPGSQNCPE